MGASTLCAFSLKSEVEIFQYQMHMSSHAPKNITGILQLHDRLKFPRELIDEQMYVCMYDHAFKVPRLPSF